MSYWGGDWEYTPPVVIGGVQVRPEAIQAPPSLPGDTVIGAYTTPPEGNVLDYCEYEPITPGPGTLEDLWEISDWAGMLEAILCRKILCFYLLPEEEPEAQPLYPNEWIDPQGYTHLFPNEFGTSGTEFSTFCMAYEYGEGAVVNLPFASLCLELPNSLPGPKWVDGRLLCLSGGGWYPVIPRICSPPDSFSGYTEFCISTISGWSGSWDDGVGGNYYERWQLTELSDTTYNTEGYTLSIFEKGTVAGFPFFGASALADEYITIQFYGYSSFSPAPPRILPPPEGIPLGGGIPAIIAGIGLLSQFLPALRIEKEKEEI